MGFTGEVINSFEGKFKDEKKYDEMFEVEICGRDLISKC